MKRNETKYYPRKIMVSLVSLSCFKSILNLRNGNILLQWLPDSSTHSKTWSKFHLFSLMRLEAMQNQFYILPSLDFRSIHMNNDMGDIIFGFTSPAI